MPGTHGLFTPVLSIGPVAIEALLAPVPVIPPSLVAAIVFDGVVRFVAAGALAALV
jgi:hypothetical protein